MIEASEEQKSLAGALAPLVAEALRPSIRRDIWQAAIVCSVAIWAVGYFMLIAKLIDQKPINQITINKVEKPEE